MTYNDNIKIIYHDEENDFLEYYYVEEVPCFYGDPIDAFITLLRDQEIDKIIGIQIQGLSTLNLMKFS